MKSPDPSINQERILKTFNLSNKPSERIILNAVATSCGVEVNYNPTTGLSNIIGYPEMVDKTKRIFGEIIMDMYKYLAKAQVEEVTYSHKGSMRPIREQFIKLYATIIAHRLFDGEVPDDVFTAKMNRVEQAAFKAAIEVEVT